MAECNKCIHNAVCKTAESCDGYVRGCGHFKEENKNNKNMEEMTMREKLIDILTSFYGVDPMYFGVEAQPLADHLIANGVTVQEWISVKDRLPEPFVSVLVQMPGEEPFPTVREGFISNDGIWQSAMFRREPGEVTHWQPMPQPPKGERQ